MTDVTQSRCRPFSPAVLAAACTLAVAAAPAAMGQSNACADAPLVAVPGSVSGTTVGATADGADDCVNCSTADVWVKFSSPFDQDVIATMCGMASWDTLLSLHTGCPGNAANQVGCNDDACSQRSTLRVTVQAGQTYYLRISGWCGATGSFTVGLSYAQTPPPVAEGPDVIVGEINSSVRYTPVGAISAYSFGATSCNIGTEDALWIVGTPAHPLVHQAMYRLANGRIEQLGQSWLKHTFGTIDDGICGTCNGHLGQVLGVGCSDPYVASQNGDRNLLGPKWEVNATTGVFPYPFTSPAWSSTIARRLQVLTSEINPATNPDAVYFAEVQYITADDAQEGNGLNNASYKRITFASATAVPALTGIAFRQEPAINAWRASDPGVTVVNADYTEQGLIGRFIVAAKATDLGNGTWDYEYAARNMNSHRSARAFAVRMPNDNLPTNVGFRDVAYHSGDGDGSIDFSGTDWVRGSSEGWYFWTTQSYAENIRANALRWGTMYNFRFRSSLPPTIGEARLTLFRPGAAGEPDELLIPGLPVPSVPDVCEADFDGNDEVAVPDIFAFLSAWFAEDAAADFDSMNGLGVPDIFAFLAAWFAGCG